MPKAGVVQIEVQLLSARAVSQWLRQFASGKSYSLLLGSSQQSYADRESALRLAKKFDGIARRKRDAPRWSSVKVEMHRDDAAWFARRLPLPAGMFGNSLPLPRDVEIVCYECAKATTKLAGRNYLTGDAIATALSFHLVDRQRLRLTMRLKKERTRRADLESFEQALRELSQNLP